MLRPEASNLERHASRELFLLGEDQQTINYVCNIIRAFNEFGHSGGSASIFIPMLNQLLQFKNLTPLTDDPTEWEDMTAYAMKGESLWQSKRNSEAFSHDGGRTYYLLSEMRYGWRRWVLGARKYHQSEEVVAR